MKRYLQMALPVLLMPVALFLYGCESPGTAAALPSASAPADVYRYGPPSRDGIGKFYMGREISHVMGHRGASWLERPSREREERTDLLVRNLPLEGDSVVADIGAGTGYFSFRIAERVPRGRVLAVDIQPEMLDIIEARKDSGALQNVETVLGTEKDPRLPAASVDLILLVDAYHEFAWPREMGLALFQALRPGGALVLVEYRGEDPSVPIKRLHKMTRRQAIDEMQAVGLRWERTERFLPQQHFMVFRRPAET
jgi:ubiquinone/menaquinone biosynthesis C-methylase UbiE